MVMNESTNLELQQLLVKVISVAGKVIASGDYFGIPLLIFDRAKTFVPRAGRQSFEANKSPPCG